MTAKYENYKLSIVKGTDPKILGYRTLDQLLNFIQNPTPSDKEFSDNVATWAKKNVGKYEAAKKGLYGFLMGKFSVREINGLIEYTPILVYDIDGVYKTSMLEDLFSVISTSPYILSAFPSPSRKGLRILMFAESALRKGRNDAEWCEKQNTLHKEYWEAGCSQLSEVLGVKTSKEVKHELRLKKVSEDDIRAQMKRIPNLDLAVKSHASYFYFTVQPQMFYLNEAAKTWTYLPPTSPTPPLSPGPVYKNNNGEMQDFKISQKLDLIHAIVINRGEARNNSTFGIACLAAEFGISEDATLAYCANKFVGRKPHPFTSADCQQTVKGAYERATFGSRTTYQLIAYSKSTLGEVGFYNAVGFQKTTAKTTLSAPTGTIRMWVLLNEESGKFYQVKKNVKTPTVTFLSQCQTPVKKGEYITIVVDLYKFLYKFESDWDYRLRVKYIAFNPIKDPSTVLFKCRPSGILYEINDHKLVDYLIAEKVIQIDQTGKKVLIPLYENYQKRQAERSSKMA